VNRPGNGKPYLLTWNNKSVKNGYERFTLFDRHQCFGPGITRVSKEEKQDLMHIAACELLSFVEYFEFQGRDSGGWPHYKVLQKPAVTGLSEQEALLRACAVQFFRENDPVFEEAVHLILKNQMFHSDD
jgi:hypothetical protein